MIGVIGDFNKEHATHVATNDALQAIDGLAFDWIRTDKVRERWSDIEALSGIFIAPASPYQDMEAVLDVILLARERGVPLVGT